MCGEQGLRDLFDELAAGVVAEVAGGVRGRAIHGGKVDNLPEKAALEGQLHIVPRPAVEFERHVHWPQIDFFDHQILALSAPPFRPNQLHLGKGGQPNLVQEDTFNNSPKIMIITI